MSSVKKSSICAVCAALCYVLPLAFHAIGSGAVFCPMHVPVLLCGLICGWSYGLFCGIAGPVISCVLSGMPSAAQLPVMIPELCTYGVITGVVLHFVHTRNTYADLYAALCAAIVCGRVVAGIASVFFYTNGSYSIGLWVSTYVLTSWPGTVIQLIFVPTIVFALMKARLIPRRSAQ